MATNFEFHKRVIFAQSMKIGTHENKAIYSISIEELGIQVSSKLSVHMSVLL